jgi:hypothetical protein
MLKMLSPEVQQYEKINKIYQFKKKIYHEFMLQMIQW